MNRTQKKRLFQGLLAMGIVLLVLSLLLDGRVPDSLGGMLCGIGSGLLAMAGSRSRVDSSSAMAQKNRRPPARPKNPGTAAGAAGNVRAAQRAAPASSAPAAAAERYQRVFRFMTAPPHIFRWSHL